MKRAWVILLAGGSTWLAAGCATAPATSAPGPLDPLKARTNAAPAFHWTAELTDGRTTARVELGWKAPDRAFLRYGPTYAIYYENGVGHYYTRQGYLRFDAKSELAKLRAAYGGVEIGGEPEPVFTLTHWEQLAMGRGMRADLGYGPPVARLSWLAEFGAWRHEEGRFRRPGLEAELDAEGFLARVKAGERSALESKELVLGDDVDDALFDPPSREGLGDLSAASRENLVRAMEDDLHRWAIAADPSDATLEALARTGLARRYDPAKMIELLRENVRQGTEALKAEPPGARAEGMKEKLELDKSKALSSVDIMETEIQGEAERLLDRIFRGMVPPPPLSRMQEIAERWKRAVARQVDAQIRKPFQQVLTK
jgi:hypothetical protein